MNSTWGIGPLRCFRRRTCRQAIYRASKPTASCELQTISHNPMVLAQPHMGSSTPFKIIAQSNRYSHASAPFQFKCRQPSSGSIRSGTPPGSSSGRTDGFINGHLVGPNRPRRFFRLIRHLPWNGFFQGLDNNGSFGFAQMRHCNPPCKQSSLFLFTQSRFNDYLIDWVFSLGRTRKNILFLAIC